MPSTASRAAAVSAAACLLVLTALGGPAWAAKSTKKVNATATLQSLVTQTSKLPRTAASKSAKAKLLRRARHARRVAAENPCLAVKDLSAYRKTLRAARIRPSAKGSKLKARLRRNLSALGPFSLQASRRLLSDKRTKRCGGGVIPSKLKAAKTSCCRATRTGCACACSFPP